MTQPQGPDLTNYRSRRRTGPPTVDERDPIESPGARPAAVPDPSAVKKQPNRNPDESQLNTRISNEHRQLLDQLLDAQPHRPGRKPKIRDLIEDLIEDAHSRAFPDQATDRAARD